VQEFQPIGTITQYFPFMDVETKKLIQNLIEEAYNYGNFVKLLSKKVCAEDSKDLVVFFATHHAAVLSDFNCLDDIAKKYGSLSIIRPDLFFASYLQGTKEDLEKTRIAADNILSGDIQNWLKMEALLIKLEAELISYPEFLYCISTSERIQESLELHPELGFFKSRYYDGLALRSQRDGDMETTLQFIQKAIDNSQEYNDLVRHARLLKTKAMYTESDGLGQSVELLVIAKEMLEKLGDTGGLADTLFQLSKIYSIRGEYEKSINDTLEVIRLRQLLSKSIGPYALTLSTLYNVVEDPQAGLEWAKMAEEEMQQNHKPRALLNQVWALVLMKKKETALELLDRVREVVLKSGMESHLAALYMIDGIIEMDEGNYMQAESSISNAFEIYEKRGSLMSSFVCLWMLAKNEVEIATLLEYDYTIKEDSWLFRLEKKARSEKLPGILAQALILKAYLLLKQEISDESSEAIIEAEMLIRESNKTSSFQNT
jgi:tetratricopeptide (TPR) repeat protein